MKICNWNKVKDQNILYTNCNNYFEIDIYTIKNNKRNNNMKHCPFCGGLICLEDETQCNWCEEIIEKVHNEEVLDYYECFKCFKLRKMIEKTPKSAAIIMNSIPSLFEINKEIAKERHNTSPFSYQDNGYEESKKEQKHGLYVPEHPDVPY